MIWRIVVRKKQNTFEKIEFAMALQLSLRHIWACLRKITELSCWYMLYLGRMLNHLFIDLHSCSQVRSNNSFLLDKVSNPIGTKRIFLYIVDLCSPVKNVDEFSIANRGTFASYVDNLNITQTIWIGETLPTYYLLVYVRIHRGNTNDCIARSNALHAIQKSKPSSKPITISGTPCL